MTDIEPVLDWAEDFEIFDDAFVHNPHPIWKDLREQGCPFARTERRQGLVHADNVRSGSSGRR